MSSDHSTIVVDDSIEVVDGRLLHVTLVTDTELTQVQVSEVERKLYSKHTAVANMDNTQRFQQNLKYVSSYNAHIQK